MMNEEHNLIFKGTFWPFGVLLYWELSLLSPYLTVITHQWEEERKEEQGRVVWGLSKDHLAKPAVFLWTPGGCGVPACFWE